MKQRILIACVVISILTGCKVKHKTVVTTDSTITSHVVDSAFAVSVHSHIATSFNDEDFKYKREDSSSVQVTTQPGGTMVWDSGTGNLTITGSATFNGVKKSRIDTSRLMTRGGTTSNTLLLSSAAYTDSSTTKTKSTTTKTKDVRPSYLYLYILGGLCAALLLIGWLRNKSPNKSK